MTLGAESSHDAAFVIFVRRHEQDLLRTAYLLTGDTAHAEDLVQTALTDLYRSWDVLPEGADSDARDTHVRRTLVKAALSSRRRPTPHAAPTGTSVREQVLALPPKQRAVIVLRHFEGLTGHVAAGLIGITPRAERALADRAHAALGNDDDRELTAQLRRAADAMPNAHVDLDIVRQSSRQAGSGSGHRDTRTMLIAGAVILALAIPAGAMALTGHLNTSPGAGQSPSTPSSSPTPPASTPTGTQPRTPAPAKSVTFALAHLPIGPLPNIAYYSDGTLYPAGGGPGTVLNLAPGEVPVSFARSGDGWVVLVVTGFGTNKKLQVRHYDTQGRITQASAEMTPWTQGLARGPDGSVAVIEQPGKLTLYGPSGHKLTSWPVTTQGQPTPLEVLPDHSVVLIDRFGQSAAASTWRLQYLPFGGDGATEKWVTSIEPASVRETGLLTSAFAPYGRCASTVPWSSGAAVPQFGTGTSGTNATWITCGYRAGYFSPDGTYLAAPATSGGGVVGILDASTGDVLTAFTNTSETPLTTLTAITWEDDSHVLVLGRSIFTKRWYLLRFGVDGSVEQVASAPLITAARPTGVAAIANPPRLEAQVQIPDS